MASRIRTAVIPAGGLGTRLLPLTRAVPKELLPVWKRPVLDYALEEAVTAGIDRVVIITAPGKEALQTYFAGRPLTYDCAPKGLTLDFVEQREPRGLGDAVRCGAPVGAPVAAPAVEAKRLPVGQPRSMQQASPPAWRRPARRT